MRCRVLGVGPVSVDDSAVDQAGSVLSGDDVSLDIVRRQRLQRLQYLELLVARGLAVDVGRWFHRDQAEYLQQVVLEHVPECAGLVVVVATGPDTERFGGGDLDVVDIARIPERLEQRVGEPGHEQVLHALLAEVVVDPEDLPLGEHGADGIVDGPSGGEVAPDRLLQHHPRRLGDHALAAQRVTDGAEQRRRARQVKHPDVDDRGRQHVGDGSVFGRFGQVDADEPQTRQEAVDGRGVEQLG